MSETNPVFEAITKVIKENQIVLFMKGTAAQPACGFSKFVVQTLDKLHLKFLDVNVLDDASLRQAIKDYSEWPTIPQLYINSEFIGGADIVRDLYNSGELFSYLNDQKIHFDKP